ncbi:MAG: bifunctional phosphoribosylaminoimidazolecarboxamide formyltransferase/IMP cyclohydrolase [Deinococcales bacterium]|nr:bifunctional phosphoribosylaminoimidazolecarboxamide formyltransferase/IMP cyclohydrolase [Deinococcales bacterium]
MATALISVSDKRGLIPFAAGLIELGFALISTGGTLDVLPQASIPAVAASKVTGHSEILGGRVKTLHPRIYGGILSRRNRDHSAELEAHGIGEIDLVVVNLYPFREAVKDPSINLTDALENIDIGGPAMVRAAAKNFPVVTVVIDPEDYDTVLERLKLGEIPDRRILARKAFAHTAAYDAAIVRYLDADEEQPDTIHLTLNKVETLRYGENPHQAGSLYFEEGASGFWGAVTRHKGLAPSYLNLFDADAAYRLVHELEGDACVIVKHANPCGVALGQTGLEAYQRAFDCDPKSAFGGVVALNCTLDLDVAEAIMDNPKADVVIAPHYAEKALEVLRSRRKAMRVLEAPTPFAPYRTLRGVDGGFLVQDANLVPRDRSDWRVVTKQKPTEDQWVDLELAYLVCAFTTSNAIVLASEGRAVGVGAGQQSRVDACELAAHKAADRAVGGACASDAFFPFRDGLDAAAAAGVKTVIQPGGSVRDDEVIAAAEEQGLAMVLTGMRHFRH